ncbi:MAG: ABC transporter ATP-binding protein [Chloroflexi bacterium]|nr:ABC transporter ATP-binding protein [Chloroflexota bacterium]
MPELNHPEPKLRIESLHKSFKIGGKRESVLAGVDLAVGPGEFVSIIGPSGCGKSTLLNIIAGLDQPDSGSVSLNGGDGGPDQPRLGRVGYMQQKDLLLPWRTVLDNTILGLELNGVSRRQARIRALELTESFGLSGFEDLYPYALSGGMRQRAAFLRTMLLGHEIILLDEPFGALDALTRIEMQEWLLNLWDSMNSTIVLITHDVDEAILMSDRVYVLTSRPGKVKMILDVDLPRPRDFEAVTSPPFTSLKARLLAALREEKGKVGADTWP